MTTPTPPVRAELIAHARATVIGLRTKIGGVYCAPSDPAMANLVEALADELERQPDAGEGWETPPWCWAKDEPALGEPGGIDHGDMIEVMLHGGTTVVGNLKSIINWRGGWMAWRRVEAYRLVAAKAQDEGRFRLYREGHQPKPAPPGDGGEEPAPAPLEIATEALTRISMGDAVGQCEVCGEPMGLVDFCECERPIWAPNDPADLAREALSKLRGG